MKTIIKLAEIVIVYGSAVMFFCTKDYYYLGVAIFFILQEKYHPTIN